MASERKFTECIDRFLYQGRLEWAAGIEDDVSSDLYFGAPSHLRQAHCDEVQAAFRAEQAQRPSLRREPEPRPSIRREAPPLPPALQPTDDTLMLHVSEELQYVRRLLDIMGDELSADTAVLVRHGTSLQAVDIAGQILGHLANIVRSSDPPGAVENIGMSELRARLKRKGGV